MKRLLLLLLISSTLQAGEGIITSLEAPILRDRSLDAPAIQFARKGQKIYIHEKHFLNGPLDIVYGSEDKKAQNELMGISDDNNYESFYETIDKNGQTAFISRRFVKLITGDIREFSQNVTPYRPDPTDYRPDEPLPKNYPLIDGERNRAAFSFSMGPDIKSNYNYNSVLEKEEFSNRYGFSVAYGRKAGWDKTDRFYFGGVFHGWTSQAKFTLFDDRRVTENRSQLGIGPYLSYDPWRDEKFRLTIRGSLSMNLTRNLVNQTDTSGFKEERLFKSISFAPRLTSFIQRRSQDGSFDFIGGFDVQFYLPHEMRSTTQPTTDFWNDPGSREDSVYVPFTAHWSLFVGVQTYY